MNENYGSSDWAILERIIANAEANRAKAAQK
jgi:hypothetical protein